MIAFLVDEEEVVSVDEEETEPDGWITENGTVQFNSIDGGYSYTPKSLRLIADFVDVEWLKSRGRI